MRADIIKLRKRNNATFVYVTHDKTEAMTLGDRIVIIKDGFIQQIGTPQEIFNQPANLFVATFIGSPQMNLFDAWLETDEMGYYVQLEGTRIMLSQVKQAILEQRKAPTQDVALGDRPEHVSICDPEQAYIQATIDVAEMMGSSVHLHMTVQGREVVVVVPTFEHIFQGLVMGFLFYVEKIHLFGLNWTS